MEEKARQKRLEDIEREKRSIRERLAQKEPDAVPPYKKPFKRGGKWYYRPTRPR